MVYRMFFWVVILPPVFTVHKNLKKTLGNLQNLQSKNLKSTYFQRWDRLRVSRLTQSTACSSRSSVTRSDNQGHWSWRQSTAFRPSPVQSATIQPQSRVLNGQPPYTSTISPRYIPTYHGDHRINSLFYQVFIFSFITHIKSAHILYDITGICSPRRFRFLARN